MSGIEGTFYTISVFLLRKPSCFHACIFMLPCQSSFIGIDIFVNCNSVDTRWQ